MEKPIVWVIADDRAGNISQSVGVAEALEFGYQMKNIEYNSYVKLPNLIRRASCLGIKKECITDILSDTAMPDIVISAGRRVAPFCRFLKKKFKGKGKKTLFAHIMHPGFGASDFDIVVVPNHDKNSNKNASNILNVTGAPHKIFPHVLAAEKIKWQQAISEIPAPYTAVFVGGDTKQHEFTKAMAVDLVEYAEIVRQVSGGSILLTTSRRTSEEAVSGIVSTILEPYYMYSWADKGENPYLGLLAFADNIIVSGDSVSMCCEACGAGKQVFIYAPENIMSAKHKRLHDELESLGYAHIVNYVDSREGPELRVRNTNLTHPEIKCLNAAYDVAKAVKSKLNMLNGD
jgi:mitochondrial fission protein ELM1